MGREPQTSHMWSERAIHSATPTELKINLFTQFEALLLVIDSILNSLLGIVFISLHEHVHDKN